MTEAYFDDVSIELNVPVTPPEEISDVLLNPGFEGLRVFSNKVAVTPGES